MFTKLLFPLLLCASLVVQLNAEEIKVNDVKHKYRTTTDTDRKEQLLQDLITSYITVAM